MELAEIAVSPHTRGWTRARVSDVRRQTGFPAHAGMDLAHVARRAYRDGFPRTRGDGPLGHLPTHLKPQVSPHTRGWTRDDRGPVLLPAGFPRTRGDGPRTTSPSSRMEWVSPHTRGWTRVGVVGSDSEKGFPAHAGMDPPTAGVVDRQGRFPRTRGDGPSPAACSKPRTKVSPHTRGWTSPSGVKSQAPSGFPAHAGMDPRWTTRRISSPRFPRTRGDGPSSHVLGKMREWVSPHTRGWTVFGHEEPQPRRGFPAHAGMDPLPVPEVVPPVGFPRTRGDGPESRPSQRMAGAVSPHTRGWTPEGRRRHEARRGFPAHAGMDPAISSAACRAARFPRTRGDGP